METEILDCGHPPDAGMPAQVQNAAGGIDTVQGWQFVLDGERKICHACADSRVLECGHTPSAHEPFTTGYGTDADGKRACYACCADKERASMIETGRACLYLVRRKSADGKESDIFTRHVTDWPGMLSFRCLETRYSPRGGGFGAQRTDAWFTGPDGMLWHAINRGDSQIARCRRVKT